MSDQRKINNQQTQYSRALENKNIDVNTDYTIICLYIYIYVYIKFVFKKAKYSYNLKNERQKRGKVATTGEFLEPNDVERLLGKQLELLLMCDVACAFELDLDELSTQMLEQEKQSVNV